MANFKRYTKVIVFDTLAGLCFLGVVLFGWIPGPTGIPLLIAGLSLLAVNHDWAERLLRTAKIKGVSIQKYIFPKDPLVRGFYDVICLAFIVGGLYIAFATEDRIISAFGVMLLTVALGIFLFNRERFTTFASLFKRRKS